MKKNKTFWVNFAVPVAFQPNLDWRNKMNLKVLRLVTTIFVSGLFASSVQAVPLIIDQHNDATPPSQGFSTPQTIGQSFVPSLAPLAAVELQINDQSIGDGNGFGAFVNIRDGGILGSLLGTSSTVSFADTPVGPFSTIFSALFEFALPLALTPGNTYVIEVLPAPTNLGGIGVFVTGFNNDGYPNGTAIADALTLNPSLAPTDLWFRTFVPGPVPEPESYTLILAGLAAMVWINRKRDKSTCKV